MMIMMMEKIRRRKLKKLVQNRRVIIVELT